MAKNLSAFLAMNAKKVDAVKYAASDRFVDENDKPMEWEIGVITAAENARIRKGCMSQVSVGKGQYTQSFAADKYMARLTARCVLFPDLNDKELQDSYGVMSAEELVTTMLTSGEFEDLSYKVMEVNGFQDEREMVEEAKN